jgi:hypothetical protein
VVRIPFQREAAEQREGLLRAFRLNIAAPHIAAQHLRNFQIHQVRHVEAWLPGEALMHLVRVSRLEQQLQHSRRVDDDQRASRSARTASAGDSAGYTGGSSRSRRISSAGSGRAAASPMIWSR